MVTFRDRARLHPDSKRTAPSIPVLCQLPAIIACFINVVFWAASAALLIMSAIFSLTFSESVLIGIMATIELAFVLAQMGVLLAVGILARSEERRVGKECRN